MTERVVFDGVLGALAASGAVVFIVLWFVPAPYGRHLRPGFGPSLSATAGWLLMETTAAVTPAATFALAPRPPGAVPLLFLALWEVHYVYRAFVYPLRRRGGGGAIPATVVALGVAFNLLNGWANGAWLSALGPRLGPEWLVGPRFVVGLALFAAGFAIHLHSDEVLLALRRPGERGHAVPQRGLHRLVAAPNYLGEIVEWCGFALLTASPAAAVFALFTAANLVPRAVSHLRWYRRTFPAYPRDRRALVPYVL